MRLFGHVGSFSSVSRNHAAGSRSLSLAVARKVCIAAARLPAVSVPVNSQFFFPTTIGRIAFSTGLLCVPCKGTFDRLVQIQPGQLSLRPEVQGAAQEVTNGLKHFLKRSRRRSTDSGGRNASEH